MSRQSNLISGTMLAGAVTTAVVTHLVTHGEARGQENPCNPAINIVRNLDQNMAKPAAEVQAAEVQAAEAQAKSPEQTQAEAIESGTGVVVGGTIGTIAGKVQKEIGNAETTLKNAAMDKLDKPIERVAEKAKKPLRSKPVRAVSAWVQIGAWIYAGWEGITYAWGRIFDGDHDAKVAAARAAERAEAENANLAARADIAAASVTAEAEAEGQPEMRGCD